MLYNIYYLYKYYYYIYYSGVFYCGIRTSYDIYSTLYYIYNLLPKNNIKKDVAIEMIILEKDNDWNIIKLI